MAIGASKTWVAGEVLTASDLNTELVRIYTNAGSGSQSLCWPATSSKDFDGNILKLDVDGDTTLTAGTLDDRLDLALQNVLLFRWDGTTSVPVTGLDFIAGATTVAVQIKATGETNTSINLVPVGTGTAQIEGDEIATILGSQFFS